MLFTIPRVILTNEIGKIGYGMVIRVIFLVPLPKRKHFKWKKPWPEPSGTAVEVTGYPCSKNSQWSPGKKLNSGLHRQSWKRGERWWLRFGRVEPTSQTIRESSSRITQPRSGSQQSPAHPKRDPHPRDQRLGPLKDRLTELKSTVSDALQPFKNNFPTLFQAEMTSRVLDIIDEIDGRRVSTVGPYLKNESLYPAMGDILQHLSHRVHRQRIKDNLRYLILGQFRYVTSMCDWRKLDRSTNV